MIRSAARIAGSTVRRPRWRAALLGIAGLGLASGVMAFGVDATHRVWHRWDGRSELRHARTPPAPAPVASPASTPDDSSTPLRLDEAAPPPTEVRAPEELPATEPMPPVVILHVEPPVEEASATAVAAASAPSASAAPAPAPSAPPPPAAPAPTGVTCGVVTCAPGKVCCNESCGTCVDPGAQCNHLMCGVPAFPDGINCGRNTCNVGDVCCNESCGICVHPGQSCDAKRRCDNAIVYPESQVCGMRATCNVGLVCCNPSCGICAPPGEACSQRICDQY